MPQQRKRPPPPLLILSGQLSKVFPNIPIRPNRNGLLHLISIRISERLGGIESAHHFFHTSIKIVRNSAWTYSFCFIFIFYSTVQKKCKRKSVFFVLCSRENSTKFHHEISSKLSRIFVESNEISLLSWRNFVLPNFCRRENSHRENSHWRYFL